MTEEEKRAIRKENYYKRRNLEPKYQAKQFVKKLKNKYNGFDFDYDGNIMSIVVTLPFRVMEEKCGQHLIIEKEYYYLQKELRSKIETYESQNFLAVVEPTYIQVVLKSVEHIDEVCNIIFQFGKEKTQKYGVYTKNGRLLKNYFE